MGGSIEINDTLQITREQGFPAELQLEQHQQKPFTAEQFAGRIFDFEKQDIRLFQPAPTPVRLVENINGKWLYWGHAEVIEQTIHSERKATSGKFRITKIYPPDVQRVITLAQTSEGKSYF